MSLAAPSERPQAARNARLAVILAGVFVLMVGAAFAAVPLYKMFCQATGFDGTIRKAEVAPSVVLNRTLDIRFDANVRGLPWDFRPDEVSQTVKIGQTGLAFFRVTNKGDKAWTGRAAYNVVPEQAGPYFQKLECFCFSDQTIQPGQTVEFPVVYFVDPKYADDPETKGKGEVTLSYTFFPSVDGDAAGQAQAVPAAQPGKKTQETTTTKRVAAAPPLGGSAAARL
jgi:cytochrome c oxidase assembly protein subunit 11